MSQRFLTVGTQRSGTTVSHVALRGHPDVRAVSDEIAIDPFFTDGRSVFSAHAKNDSSQEGKMWEASTARFDLERTEALTKREKYTPHVCLANPAASPHDYSP